MLKHSLDEHKHVKFFKYDAFHSFLKVVRPRNPVVQVSNTLAVINANVYWVIVLIGRNAFTDGSNSRPIVKRKLQAAASIEKFPLVVVLPNSNVLVIEESQIPLESPRIKS